MTGFDILAGLLLLASALFGYLRGATREVTTVVALILAVVIAVAGLRYAGPLVGHFIHAAWLANAAAALGLFILAYVGLRMAGGVLIRGVRRTETLSGLDRTLGFGVGLIRGLVVLGAFALLISAATPAERRPDWFMNARLYPVAMASAGMLRVLAPKGMAVFHDVAPAMADAVGGKNRSDGDSAARRARGGYTAAQRKSLDELVEKSR
jgi:membrane protein required for colicin V production